MKAITTSYDDFQARQGTLAAVDLNAAPRVLINTKLATQDKSSIKHKFAWTVVRIATLGIYDHHRAVRVNNVARQLMCDFNSYKSPEADKANVIAILQKLKQKKSTRTLRKMIAKLGPPPVPPRDPAYKAPAGAPAAKRPAPARAETTTLPVDMTTARKALKPVNNRLPVSTKTETPKQKELREAEEKRKKEAAEAKATIDAIKMGHKV